MIRGAAGILSLVLFAPHSCGQRSQFTGAWLENPTKWSQPPPELELKERFTEAALVYFREDHNFLLIYATVIRGPSSEVVSRGDGRVIYIGTWSQNGPTLRVEYRLVDRTVLTKGESLPGPTQVADARLKDGALLFDKMRFRPDARLSKELQDILHDQLAGIPHGEP